MDELLDEGEKLFPQLRRMRLLRAYGGVRPLYDPSETGTESREVTRAHVVLDHATRDGIGNLTSIVGGKLTTYRLMAQDTADVVARKAGRDRPCDDGAGGGPGSARRRHAALPLARRQVRGARGARRRRCRPDVRMRARNARDAQRRPRPALAVQPGRRSPGDAAGHGPVPGRFCTFRAAGAVADHAARVTSDPVSIGDTVEKAMADFIRERQRGTLPIAHGRQLQEAVITAGLHWGTLGLDSLLGTGAGGSDAKR